MIKIHTLVLGDYQTNCYIVHKEGSQSCAIIDPGYEPRRILDTVSALGLKIEAILLTHGHFDHVGGVQKIVEETGCALWMSQSDWSQFPSPFVSYLYPLANCDFTEVHFCEDGEIIRAGGLSFEAIATPGHTHGSLCFRCENALFSGDTLFRMGCGRTDLPGGSQDNMVWSLERLAELEGDYHVFPGHAESTTLAQERAYNPYMRT